MRLTKVATINILSQLNKKKNISEKEFSGGTED